MPPRRRRRAAAAPPPRRRRDGGAVVPDARAGAGGEAAYRRCDPLQALQRTAAVALFFTAFFGGVFAGARLGPCVRARVQARGRARAGWPRGHCRGQRDGCQGLAAAAHGGAFDAVRVAVGGAGVVQARSNPQHESWKNICDAMASAPGAPFAAPTGLSNEAVTAAGVRTARAGALPTNRGAHYALVLLRRRHASACGAREGGSAGAFLYRG